MIKRLFFAMLFTGIVAIACNSEETGSLAFDANGEDFVRQGFVSKDGWEIAFDSVMVTLADVTAYQTDPPYDAASGVEPQGKAVAVPDVITVDLAEGDADAEPLRLAVIDDAPAGQYNAVSWRMLPASDGPAAGATVLMAGSAQKDGNTVDFSITVTDESFYSCGEYVGDERKGILAAGDSADVELTFHFDHIFGDGDAPLDDSLNVGALGFDPLAALAENGQLNINSAELQAQLSAEDYETFIDTFTTLGHVGEGHCYEAVGGYTGHSAP
ncbi:MAG: DUF4382 domain-containing protein [Anaerolineae bacterium]|nr:DUF4382 domain-containing protein [Anaerolineae bacterium]